MTDLIAEIQKAVDRKSELRLLDAVATGANTVTVGQSTVAVTLPAIIPVTTGQFCQVLEQGANRVILGPVGGAGGLFAVTSYGATGDGVTDDTAAIQAAIDAAELLDAGVVLFPPGDYVVSALTVDSPGVRLQGTNASTLIPDSVAVSLDALITVAADNVTVSRLNMTAQTNYTHLVLPTAGISGLRIEDCNITDGCLLGSVTTAYASANADGEVTNVTVRNNTITIAAAAEDSTEAAIRLTYVVGAVVEGNTISGGNHGISYWGGNADPTADGVATAARKAGDLRIIGNTVSDVNGGGIWGSMGKRITITGNTVKNCGDVGIDVEGSFDCSITGNVVENTVNGNIATFFLCQNVSITGNTVVATDPATYGSTLLRVNNGNTGVNRGGRVDGNVFECRSTSVIGQLLVQVTHGYTLANNELVNVKIVTTTTNNRRSLIQGNRMTFEFVAGAAFYAIEASNHTNSDDVLASIVRDNTIVSIVTQPAGTMAVRLREAGANTNKSCYVLNNVIWRWPTGVYVEEDASNAARTFTFVVANNVINATTEITSVAGGASASALVLAKVNNIDEAGVAIP